MEIFDVFSMNGIENYPVAGEFFLENVILRSHRHTFPRISIPPPLGLSKGGGGIHFSRGGGAVKYPGGGGGGEGRWSYANSNKSQICSPKSLFSCFFGR